MNSFYKLNTLFIRVLLLSLSLHASAAQPELQTKGQVIYLADNLDEADQLGWCIDTMGRGFADTLQAHSCKPRGGDVQFSYNAQQHRIQSVTFSDYCMSLNNPDNSLMPFGLVPCNANDPKQGFVFDSATGLIQLQSDMNQCVVVGESSRSAGPFMSRDLILSDCENTEPKLAVWVFQSE